MQVTLSLSYIKCFAPVPSPEPEDVLRYINLGVGG